MKISHMVYTRLPHTCYEKRVCLAKRRESSRWSIQRVKIARIYKYMMNIRKDYLDEVSNEVIKIIMLGIDDLQGIIVTVSNHVRI